MTWKCSIKQEPANDIFGTIGVRFERNETEGCWLALRGESDRVLRRPTLTEACKAVLSEWVTPNPNR
jgi:hypothetical protein